MQLRIRRRCPPYRAERKEPAHAMQTAGQTPCRVARVFRWPVLPPPQECRDGSPQWLRPQHRPDRRLSPGNVTWIVASRTCGCLDPPSTRAGIQAAALFRGRAHMQRQKRPIERLCQRSSRCRRRRSRIVPLHGQQHRSARSGPVRTRIPIRGYRQHRTRRQSHQAFGDGPHHDRARRLPFPWCQSRSARPRTAAPHPPASPPPRPAAPRNGCESPRAASSPAS